MQHANHHKDVIVVGAGVMGLSVAHAAQAAGLDVVVLEQDRPAAGASGGIVGALTPHAPRRWRAMMAFQFRALLDLAQHIRGIETESGLRCGYARHGRLTPLPTEKARAQAEDDAAAAPDLWDNAAHYVVHDAVPEVAEGWISPAYARFGVVEDTVSARVSPRAYCAALTACLGDRIRSGVRVEAISPDGVVQTGTGEMSAGAVVLAGGAAGWSLAGMADPAFEGTAVKGQSARLAVSVPTLPVIYQDGLYIVPHDDGTVAVGSTSEKRFAATGTDALLDDVLARAVEAAPRLAGAAVVERWAGLRPKPPGREPLIGPLPETRLWFATGGFKISFGIAHAVADALVAEMTGRAATNPLPETFLPANRRGEA